jgi:hypothetical protein
LGWRENFRKKNMGRRKKRGWSENKKLRKKKRKSVQKEKERLERKEEKREKALSIPSQLWQALAPPLFLLFPTDPPTPKTPLTGHALLSF